MRLIVPMLVVISVVFIIFISIWRVDEVNTEIIDLENNIESSASYWIENYYVEMDTLAELFFDTSYSGSDYLERVTTGYSGILGFWNDFSLAPGVLSGVLFVEETPEGRKSVYLNNSDQKIYYEYSGSIKEYLAYAEELDIINPFLMTSFPLYPGKDNMNKPFIFLKGHNRECLIFLDYDSWRYALPEALDSAVLKKVPSSANLYSYLIEEGDQNLAEKIISSNDKDGFPLTLVSFDVDYLTKVFSGDYTLPDDLKKNGNLAYSISIRSRLLNKYQKLHQRLLFEETFEQEVSPQIEVYGKSLWAVFSIDKTAVFWRAVKIQLGAILLSYAALIFLIVLMFILIKYNKKTAGLVREQQTFIANVSHELRTPLAVICNAGTNLEQGYIKEPGHIQQYGHLITDEGRRLGGMVESILLYSGFQLGRFNKEDLEVDEILDGVIKPIEFLCEQKEIIFEKKITHSLAVFGDKNGISSAITNLLRNAIIHGGSGGYVGLTVRSSADGDFLEIIVKDRGPGVDKHEHKNIFQPFSRGSNAGRMAVPGSGLGLSLVKKVALTHGGNVLLRSASGDGAVFTLRLRMRGLDEQ